MISYIKDRLKLAFPGYETFDTIKKLEVNTIALMGEFGEFCNNLKKYAFYSPDKNKIRLEDLKKEICDVQFHFSEMLDLLEITPEEMETRIINQTKNK